MLQPGFLNKSFIKFKVDFYYNKALTLKSVFWKEFRDLLFHKKYIEENFIEMLRQEVIMYSNIIPVGGKQANTAMDRINDAINNMRKIRLGPEYGLESIQETDTVKKRYEHYMNTRNIDKLYEDLKEMSKKVKEKAGLKPTGQRRIKV